MKKIYLLSFLFITAITFGQNFGTFASGVKINNTIYNTTASAPIHQIDPSPTAQSFDGVNLGNFGVNSSCANITGAEVKTWKNASGNVCSATVRWRVYSASTSPSGSFNSYNLSSVYDCNLSTNIFNDGLGPCGGNDQKWKNYSTNANFITGLTAGSYILEIYFEYTGSDVSSSTCETTKYINNSGANFKATFTISDPTTNPTVSSTLLCEGDVLTLTANPANGVAPYTYSWTGPNGYTSTAQNPTLITTLSSVGTYTLVVTDACGAVSTAQSTASVGITPKTVPSFDAILPAICNGGTAPILPNISTNGISGTWNPATVNNTITGSYVFTPDAGQCASTFTQTIFVINNVTPTFTLPATLCQGASVPQLHLVSNNGIQGTWSPSTIDNVNSGTYTFTPNPGQCATIKTISITIIPIVTPVFTLPSSVCQGGTVPVLPTTSNNGIAGTWNPATVSNTVSGTYIFTHTAGVCASNASLNFTITPNVTPTFTAIAPICANATAPVLPTTSNNGITGTWTPATVDTTTSGTYTFTPDAGLCALTTTLDVTVNPNITPTFDPIAPVCYQSTAPSLPATSTNGITGTWNPATISNTASGTYNFTPTAGQCAFPTTLDVTVNTITPTFDPIAPFCSGATAPLLAGTSTNGITGTWNPATINNTTSGTYTFTPDAGQCATTTTLSTTVTPMTTTTFDPIAPICANATAPILPTTSTNGVTGTWNPATVDNTTTGTYTFTPDAGLCATPVTITITVTPNVTPSFTINTTMCANGTAPILPGTSNNGVAGTWNPTTVDNTTSATYVFTPNAGLCALSTSVDITVNPNTTPTFDPIAPFCAGTTAPSLPGTSTNGITGTWNPATVNNTTSATYTFTPTAGLCALPTTLDITVSPNITPTFDPIPPVCYGGTAPTLPGTSTNGITGTWNPTTVSNTTAGTYTFTPDAGQCATTATLSISINATIPTFDPISPICYGTTAPSLPTTSTNGITGTWNPATVSNTASGTYNFSADAGQCALNTTISITVNTVTPTFTAIPNVCYGATAPTLPGTSNNGITGTWNPTTVSNTTAGTYTFTPDANQCATVVTMNIGINVVNPTFNPIAAICANATAPALPATSSNGISGTWNPATVDNTTSATYNFTPNANQCATTATLSVTVTPNVTPSFNPIPDVCYGGTAPSLPGTSTNGITGTWNPATVSNTTAGTYTFTPTTGLCATSVTINIGINQITPNFDPIATVCYGSTAPLLPGTSTNGITGTWNPGTVSNTTGGTYTFTPNAGQCATVVTITINVNTINPSFDPIPNVCYGSTAPSLPGTSTNGITGTWNPATISNTIAGTYTFTPDANQCATTATLTIGINVVTPTFNAIAPICENGTAPVLPSTSTNGINGTWNPATISNTVSGIYNFTPDANQCATTATLSVTVTPNVTPTFNAIPDVCYGGTAPSLPLTSTNGISGTWNPSTVSNTTAGSYLFTPNAGQCATTATINIGINSVTPNFNAIAPICANATAPVLPATSTNGIHGTWNPATVDNTTTANYNFTPDANQCATSTTLTITVNPNVTPAFNAVAPICYQGNVPVLPTTSNNGITGTWNPPTVSNTVAGTYFFTPDANQCATTTTATTTINIITPTFTQIPDVCYASTAPTLPTTSSNGITGTWNPAIVSNTTAGTYTFTPDANQCATVATMTIGINTITPAFTQIPDVCYGSAAPSLPTTSSNGISGTWNPATISNTTAGTYTFTPNANQCAVGTTMTIGINMITPNFNAIAGICENATAPILPSTSLNGIAGTWNPATVSNTVSGTYNFTPNAGQCATTATLSVTVTPNTTPTFNFATTICQFATAPTLPTTSVNGVHGTWNPSTIDTTNSGSYVFTPDAGQCALSSTIAVTIVVNVTPTFNAIAPICSGSTSPILPTTSLNGYTGTWNPSVVNNMNNGTYTFTAAAGQCATPATLSVTVYQSPTDIEAQVTNVHNNNATGAISITNIVSGIAPYQYSLNNAAFSVATNYTDLAPGDYTLTVKDANGCEYVKTFTIDTSCMFPTGISPNGDGLNDTFNLNGCNVIRIDFFNRYGTKVNGYTNYANQWDGTTFDSKQLPDGTYFYEADLSDGTTKTGWVYIAR